MHRLRLSRASSLALAGACLLSVLVLAAPALAKPVSSQVLKREFALNRQLPDRFSTPATIASRRVGEAFGSSVAVAAPAATRVEDNGSQTLAIVLASVALAVALASGLVVVVRAHRVSPT
jgi:hypothetical protein